MIALLALSLQDCMHGEGGVLTAWDAECRLQRLLYEEPLDAYSLHVQDFRQVAVPTFLQYKRSPVNVQEMHQSKLNKTHSLLLEPGASMLVDTTSRMPVLCRFAVRQCS